MSNLTLAAVEDSITAEDYYVFPGTTMTVCCMTVRGCLHLIGESDCIYPGDFDADKGRVAARGKAMVKVWDQAAIAVKLELYGSQEC